MSCPRKHAAKRACAHGGPVSSWLLVCRAVVARFEEAKHIGQPAVLCLDNLFDQTMTRKQAATLFYQTCGMLPLYAAILAP